MAISLEVKDLDVRFDGRPVLTQVSLIISEGNIHAIIGHNGSGKSTLLAYLTGLIPHGRGPTEPEEVSMFYVPESELDYFPGFLTLREILSVIQDAYGVAPDSGPLASLGEEGFLDRRLASLSHGERKKACLAIALESKARVLVLDEILEGMDIEARPLVKKVFRGYATGGRAVLLTSHEAISDILSSADTISVMRSGRMLGTFSREELTSIIEAAGSRAELVGLEGIYRILEARAQ